MNIWESFRNAARNMNAGKLAGGVAVAAVGAAVSIGLKKMVGRETKKSSTGSRTEDFSTYGQREDEPTVNFVFGTGKVPEADEIIRTSQWEMDEIYFPHKTVSDEFGSSVKMPDIEERLV